MTAAMGVAEPSALLPIEEALPDLLSALETRSGAVLIAPPGAGKTTRVPLALLDAPWRGDGRILMLEPRRVAARAAAERMAETIGEKVGETVGYRIRNERRVSNRTRIEVVTEGILTRMLQSDPELSGVAAVIFDEFHERSIHADLGLALTLECQDALREDLRILVMSATLDGGAVSAVMKDAPLVQSEGRMFPVETRWLDAPWRGRTKARDAFERAVCNTVLRALSEEEGDLLVFLPGVAEIGRVERLLSTESLSARILPLHGGLPFERQRAALRPSSERRVVLSTAIAETSLTIQGVRIVVDGGLSRKPSFDAGAGMTRLITTRVSKAAAVQRRGRAGRVEPGVCYRVWTKGEEGGFAPQDRAEILDADLAPLVLDLAQWGVRDPAELRWLDLPPEAAVAQAKSLLVALGALNEAGAITEHGKALASEPLHPRLAHMLMSARAMGAGALGGQIAAILEERDPLSGTGVDLALRVEALRNPKRYAQERPGQIERGVLSRIRDTAKSLGRKDDGTGSLTDIGMLIAAAYPDRIAMRRKGDAPRFLLSGGKGASLFDAGDSLAGDAFLAIAHLDGNPREARIRLAARLTLKQIEARFGERIRDVDRCVWDAQSGTVMARKQRCLDAIVLDDRPWKDATSAAVAEAALEGLRSLGLSVLPWEGAAEQLRARIGWIRAHSGADDLPDWSDQALQDSLQDWLLPHLGKVRSKAGFGSLPLAQILTDTLDWEARQKLDQLAPKSLKTPAGTSAKIDYSSDPPALEVKIQEMFGETRHPCIGHGDAPLLIRFLSPARQPVQVTGDLPGFWASSYADVRKDLRGRYPKHYWPEDPMNAEATARAKPRK